MFESLSMIGWEMMSELIVAGFADPHTAHLASAAFARLRDEILTEGPGVAVVFRRRDGQITVREAIELSPDGNDDEAFWHSLAGKIFAALPKPGTQDGFEPEDVLLALGVSESFLREVDAAVAPETAALIVACKAGERDRIADLLRGFGPRLARTRLTGDDPQAWLATLHKH